MTDRPMTTTPLAEAPLERKVHRQWSDHQAYGDVSIRLDWQADFELAVPRTLTQDEAADIMQRFAEEHLRSRCMRLVLTMPEQLLPFVCPQLEELIDYEAGMLIERQAHKPQAIRESWRALPAPV